MARTHGPGQGVPWLCLFSSLVLAACSGKDVTTEMTLPASNLAGGARADSAEKPGPESTAPTAGQAAVTRVAASAGQSGGAATGSSGGPAQTAAPSGSGGNAGNAAQVAGIGGAGSPAMGSAGMGSAGMGSAGMGSAGTAAMYPIADDGWPMATLADFGLDEAQMDGLADQLQTTSGGTRAGLVVVKEGALVYEKYWQGDADTMHQVFSCTKSWGSTLIGIAVRKGLIKVEDPVTKWVPQPAPEVGTGALVKHLLTQTGHTTPPGTAFSYNSGSIVNTLPEILEAATGMSSHAFFQSFLAEPLKLTMTWPTCPAGGCVGTRYKEDYIQFGDQGPNAVLESTIRDQAKLGWLWLDDGVWNGEKLIDTEYIQAATQPSFDFQAVYGYLWWLNREGQSSVLSYDPAVPNDLFHAVGGIGNCSVAVLPTQRMVIVHVGSVDAGGLGGHWDVFAPLFKP